MASAPPAQVTETTLETRQLFAVEGLFCGGCARGLETRLRRLDGVVDAGVHFVTASALLRWDDQRCDRRTIEDCVLSAGYRFIEYHDLAATAERMASATRWLAWRFSVALFFGMWTMAAALVLYVEPDLDALTAWWLALGSGVLAAPAIGFSGASLLRMGGKSFRMRVASIDLLLTIGVTSAVALSLVNLARGRSDVYFDAATMLIMLRLLGQLIETRVRGDAIGALQAIEQLAPELAQLADGTAPRPIRDIAVHDLVVVDAGAAVTVDGIIEAGSSALDRTLLTGEARPQAVEPGDRIQAGTFNLLHRLTVRVDRGPGDRDVDRMGGRVALEIAARGEPDGEMTKLVDWLVRLTPMLTLVVLAGRWVRTGSIIEGMTAALAVAVVICPCALTIARPITLLRAVRAGANLGLRIAEPAALDALARVRTIIFDKTGTITSGHMVVAGVTPVNGCGFDDLLAYAARAETGIEHPIARAIIAKTGPRGLGGTRDMRGASADDGMGRMIRVTSAEAGGDDFATRLSVWVDAERVGDLTIVDEVDEHARTTISWLRSQGVNLKLATGDGQGAARAAAKAIGLAADQVIASCLPGEKADLVHRSAGPVLFVGDGINDAPALAAADIGMTVARAHATATATAAIAIVDGGLERVVTAVRLAHRTRRLLRESLWFAVAYNAVFVPAAMLGTLTPVTAAIAMTASSMLVVVNTYRLT